MPYYVYEIIPNRENWVKKIQLVDSIQDIIFVLWQNSQYMWQAEIHVLPVLLVHVCMSYTNMKHMTSQQKSYSQLEACKHFKLPNPWSVN